MEKFTSFATKRVAIGVLLVGIVVVAVGHLSGFIGKQPPIQLPVHKGADETADASESQPGQAVAHGSTRSSSGYPKSVLAAALTPETTSKGAIAAIKRAHPDVEKLIYLYPASAEGDEVMIGFPGKLLVSPDDTALSDLLKSDEPKIEITVDAAGMNDFLADKQYPALPVLDAHQTLFGIVTTDEGFAEAKSRKPGVKAVPEKILALKGDQTPDQAHEETQTQEAASAGAYKAAALSGHAEEEKPPAAPAESHEAVVEETGHQTQKAPAASEEAHPEAAAAKKEDAHGEEEAHKAALPTDKPMGVVFIQEAITPLHNELTERWWGWRPNDIINVTDNVNNFQLGVLEVARRTAVILAERISRTGITAAFDPNLESAMNWFMIKPTRYWFPSAESKYMDGLKEWRKYEERLERGEAKFYHRADNLIPLLMAYEDLLGSCEENLVKHTEENGEAVSFFKADDYIFYAKGVVSAMATILAAIEVDFNNILVSRRAIGDLHHAIESCHHVVAIDPWIIFDSDHSSIFANHRANMAAPLSHARFYLGVIIKALST